MSLGAAATQYSDDHYSDDDYRDLISDKILSLCSKREQMYEGYFTNACLDSTWYKIKLQNILDKLYQLPDLAYNIPLEPLFLNARSKLHEAIRQYPAKYEAICHKNPAIRGQSAYMQKIIGSSFKVNDYANSNPGKYDFFQSDNINKDLESLRSLIVAIFTWPMKKWVASGQIPVTYTKLCYEVIFFTNWGLHKILEIIESDFINEIQNAIAEPQAKTSNPCYTKMQVRNKGLNLLYSMIHDLHPPALYGSMFNTLFKNRQLTYNIETKTLKRDISVLNPKILKSVKEELKFLPTEYLNDYLDIVPNTTMSELTKSGLSQQIIIIVLIILGFCSICIFSIYVLRNKKKATLRAVKMANETNNIIL